jgi:hypothetical protein
MDFGIANHGQATTFPPAQPTEAAHAGGAHTPYSLLSQFIGSANHLSRPLQDCNSHTSGSMFIQTGARLLGTPDQHVTPIVFLPGSSSAYEQLAAVKSGKSRTKMSIETPRRCRPGGPGLGNRSSRPHICRERLEREIRLSLQPAQVDKQRSEGITRVRASLPRQ